MAFQTALTIKETIASIHSKKYLLPSIQREFVWDCDQITQLFDSLNKDNRSIREKSLRDQMKIIYVAGGES